MSGFDGLPALRKPSCCDEGKYSLNLRATTESDTTRTDTLARQAYLALREGIILGRYREGERLAEQRLAQELAVSRVPLREALPQLEMEGFVHTVPRRSAVVARWDTRAVNDLFDLRLYFDAGAARYAARQVAAGASPEELDQALELSREVVREGDPYKVAQASASYHEAIVNVAGNQLMKNIMRSIAGRMVWLFYLTSQLAADIALEEHAQLTNAIRSGNERLAESIAYAHIEHDRIPSFRALEAQQTAYRRGVQESPKQ